MTQRNELKKFIFSFTNGDLSLKILPRRVDVDGKKIIIGKSAKKTEWTKFINYRKCEHIPMELLKYRNQWSAGWQIGLVYHFKWLGHQHGLNIGKYSGFCGQPALPLESCFYIPLFLEKKYSCQTSNFMKFEPHTLIQYAFMALLLLPMMMMTSMNFNI